MIISCHVFQQLRVILYLNPEKRTSLRFTNVLFWRRVWLSINYSNVRLLWDSPLKVNLFKIPSASSYKTVQYTEKYILYRMEFLKYPNPYHGSALILVGWIQIRIQEGKKLPIKNGKGRNSSFEVLDVLFCEFIDLVRRIFWTPSHPDLRET